MTYRRDVAGRTRPRDPTATALTRAAWIRQAFLEHHAGRLSGTALRDLIRKTRHAK